MQTETFVISTLQTKITTFVEYKSTSIDGLNAPSICPLISYQLS